MIFRTKNKSTDGVKRIGIFVESPRFLSYAIHLGRGSGAVVITNSREVYDRITSQDIMKQYIPDWGVINLLSFKGKFKAFAVDRIILFSDTSPVSFWIQKHYKTLMVSEDFVFGRGYLFYKSLPSFFAKQGFFLPLLEKIAGAKCLLDDEVIYFLSCRLGPILVFLAKRIVFDFKPILLCLGGRYATKISVYSQKHKELYMKNGIIPEKLIVVGSLAIEGAIETINSWRYNGSKCSYKPTDVVFFTQPFHRYSGVRAEMWIREVSSFVRDCDKANVSYLIALHPRDDINFYLKFAPKECIVAGPRTDEQNIALANLAKLVVLKTTTTVVLPFLLKKPVAYINYSSYADMNMMKHFQKEMILYDQNSVYDIMSFLDKKAETVIAHQNNEIVLVCTSIIGVKRQIMDVAQAL